MVEHHKRDAEEVQVEPDDEVDERERDPQTQHEQKELDEDLEVRQNKNESEKIVEYGARKVKAKVHQMRSHCSRNVHTFVCKQTRAQKKTSKSK